MSDLCALLALTAVPLVLGVAESGLLVSPQTLTDAQAKPAAPARLAQADVRFESTLMLTESPVSSEFVTQSVKRSKQRAQRNRSVSESIASDRSGLTSASQASYDVLYPGESSDDSLSVFPALPNDSKQPRPRFGPSGTYRTLCVRLCDGFYWPVSFSTTRDGFGEDKQTCEASCGSPVQLFYYQNPDGTPEEAIDLKGEQYASLANAFRYRSEYVDSCKCQPDPWDAASLERHRKYAELTKEGKLALYDNRKPRKGRRKQILVDLEGPTVTSLVEPQSTAVMGAESPPKTTIGSTKKRKLLVVAKGSGTGNLGAAMGITKVGQSASGKSYSARKKAASAFQSRK